MKSHYLKDLFNLSSIDYALLFTNNSIELIRCSLSDNKTTLISAECSINDINSIDNAISRVIHSEYYYGQALAIILNNRYSYTYLKKTKDKRSSQIFDNVKLLINDNFENKFEILEKGKNKFLVFQAINKEFLKNINKIFTQKELSILEIFSLPVFLLSGLRYNKQDDKKITIIELINNQYEYIIENDDNILCGTMNNIDDEVVQLKQTFFNNPENVLTEKHLLASGYNSSIKILSKCFNKSHRIKKTSFVTNNSKIVANLKIATNSLKLLTTILLFLTLVLGISGIVTSLISSNDEIISQYQNKYSEKLRLEQEHKHLEEQFKSLSNSIPKEINKAPVISAFCQSNYSNFYLSQISLIQLKNDSLSVEIEGKTKSEDKIFRYQGSCDKYIKPYRVSINSIKPEIYNTNRIPDTLLTFKLSTIIYE